MKNKVYFGVILRILLLFGIGIFGSYLPEHLRNFFGDKLVDPINNMGIDRSWDWGVRHYWYFTMIITIFLWSLINFFISSFNILKKEYPNNF